MSPGPRSDSCKSIQKPVRFGPFRICRTPIDPFLCTGRSSNRNVREGRTPCFAPSCARAKSGASNPRCLRDIFIGLYRCILTGALDLLLAVDILVWPLYHPKTFRDEVVWTGD